ncbi:hypothetical protein D3C77_460390 [compost metagenome]
MLVLGLGPQPIAHARFKTPGTTSTLGGAGARNTLGVEPGHATAWIKSRHPRQPGINHHPHAVDGQAGFGDVGGQHHLALTYGWSIDGCTLGVEVQLTVQGAQEYVLAIAQRLLQLLVDPANFCLARQKHQQTA